MYVMRNAQLDRMQISELEQLKVRIDKIIAIKQVKERATVRTKLVAMAAKSGILLGDVVYGNGAQRLKKRKLPIKYKNPDNTDDVWSGRGRTPRWMTAKIKAGAKAEDFRV